MLSGLDNHINILECVHPDEVGKIGTRHSTRQEDGGNVDNPNSRDVNDIEALVDCELNYLLAMNQISLKKLFLMMSGKKLYNSNMMLSSRMVHGSWWNLHLIPNQLAANGSTKTSTNHMAHLTSIQRSLWRKFLNKNKA